MRLPHAAAASLGGESNEALTQAHPYMGTSVVEGYKSKLNSCLGAKIV